MEKINIKLSLNGKVHPWLYPVKVAFVPGLMDPLLDEFAHGLMQCFQQLGNTVLEHPEEGPEALLTTALFNQPVNWRESLFLTARRRYHLERHPTVFTIVHITPAQLQASLELIGKAVIKDAAGPEDYPFPGMTGKSYYTLHEQGRRGGPIMSLIRIIQSQAKCLRILLVVGDQYPIEAYTFDLVGGHPRTPASDLQAFYTDLALRVSTAVCTHEITNHEVVGEPIPQKVWKSLSTPPAMLVAGKEFGIRNFFTEMVSVANLVNVPLVDGAISSQYSEGCYSTWDTDLGALVTTVTGSARPVDKGHLTEDELAVIVSARPDGLGARIRHVEGKRNDPPSSEAVELIEMDSRLPRLAWNPVSGPQGVAPELSIFNGSGLTVPVVRSKLHGHRGVRSFDPRRVEHAFLDAPYYHYPVSCSTEAQAHAIQAAFGRSEALNNPADPRQLVFTVLPGHGMVVVEKWTPGKAPFQLIWELMDEGAIEISSLIPQGPLVFKPDNKGRMVIEEK